jgi:hypothetical protein
MAGIGGVAYQGMTRIEAKLNEIFSVSLPRLVKCIPCTDHSERVSPHFSALRQHRSCST